MAILSLVTPEEVVATSCNLFWEEPRLINCLQHIDAWNVDDKHHNSGVDVGVSAWKANIIEMHFVGELRYKCNYFWVCDVK